MEHDNYYTCPCHYIDPCHEDCTCVNPFSSRGCSRCCAVGNLRQRTVAARQLADVIDEDRRLNSEALHLLMEAHGRMLDAMCRPDTDPMSRLGSHEDQLFLDRVEQFVKERIYRRMK